MDSTDTRSPDTQAFIRLAEARWGYGWQTRAAEHFEVSGRTVRHWVAGQHPVPPGVLAELRTLSAMAPPPGSDSSEDRDEACRQALEPGLTDLRNRALSAGWHPAEIVAAILSLTVDEMRAGVGDVAARQVLHDVAGSL